MDNGLVPELGDDIAFMAMAVLILIVVDNGLVRLLAMEQALMLFLS